MPVEGILRFGDVTSQRMQSHVAPILHRANSEDMETTRFLQVSTHICCFPSQPSVLVMSTLTLTLGIGTPATNTFPTLLCLYSHSYLACDIIQCRGPPRDPFLRPPPPAAIGLNEKYRGSAFIASNSSSTRSSSLCLAPES